MASDEHQNLSAFVKHIHKQLRIDTKEVGPDEAWKKHIADGENLKKYAKAMHSLAVDHWELKYKRQSDKLLSRVTWTYNFCMEYFYGGEILRQREREKEIASKIELKDLTEIMPLNKQLKLLDVGSCYNPFEKFDCFDVVAVDIAPAIDSVLYCDFLNLDVIKHDSEISFNSTAPISHMPESSYDVVIFSLLLEYLPSAKQRLCCCEKAYKLLKTEGILIIITPDSKHVGANARIMKSWRHALAEVGFSRIKYEKLVHLHCMVFRKSLHENIARRWARLHGNKIDIWGLCIPQDFNSEVCDNERSTDSNSVTRTFIEMDHELPFYFSDEFVETD